MDSSEVERQRTFRNKRNYSLIFFMASSSKKYLKRKFAKNTTDRQNANKPAHSI